MKLNEAKLQELINVIYANNCVIKRNVIYRAIADTIVNYILDKENVDETYIKSKLKFRMSYIVNKLNELVIIDRVAFEKALQRSLGYKLNKCSYDRMVDCTYNNILEALGVTEYYSNEELKDINENIDLYKTIVKGTRANIQTLSLSEKE